MQPKDKYEFTDEIMEFDGKTLRRIRALRNFFTVKAGDVGGFIQHCDNLSHYGDCWVEDNACVCEDAAIVEAAWVGGHAIVRDKARIGGNAYIGGTAVVTGSAHLTGGAHIEDNVIIVHRA